MPVPSTPYIAEYVSDGGDRFALNIANPAAASGYTLEVVQWHEATHTVATVSVPLGAMQGGMNYHLIGEAFYDFFDVIPVGYYNAEIPGAISGARPIAFVLKQDATVVDTLGDPSSVTELLPDGGFLERNDAFGAAPGGYLATDYNDTNNHAYSSFGNYISPPPSEHGPPPDTTAPVVIGIEPVGGQGGNAADVDFAVEFSEAVSGVTASSFALVQPAGGSAAISSVTQVDATHYAVRVAGMSGDGAFGLRVAADGGGIADLAHNPLPGGFAGTAYTRDDSVPAVVGLAPQGSALGNSTSVAFLASFSEDVTGVTAGSFVLEGPAGSGGTIDSVVAIGPRSYVVAVSGLSGDGDYRLKVTAGGGGIRDAVGNSLPGGDVGQAYVLDTAAPTLSGSGPDGNPAGNASEVDFLVAFSSDVTNIGAGSFILSAPSGGGGSIASVTPITADRYIVRATGLTGDGEFRIGLALGGGGVVDLAGNPVTAGATGTAFVRDGTGPTFVSVAPYDATSGNATSTIFDVAFSEAVAGANAADFELILPAGGAGQVSSVTRIDATHYRVEVTGLDGDGSFRLGLASGQAVVDLAGNLATGGAPGLAYERDGTEPMVARIAPSGGDLGNVSVVDFDVSFSEAVSGVTAESFVLVRPVGGAGDITSVTATSVGTYRVRVEGLSGDGEFRLDVAADGGGITDQAGNPLPRGFTGEAYARDGTAPELLEIRRAESGGPETNATSLVFHAVFGEEMSNLTAADFEVVGSTASVVAIKAALGLPYGYEILVGGGDLASVEGEVTLRARTGGTAVDAAGNALLGTLPVTAEAYLLDRTVPGAAGTGAIVASDADRDGAYGEGDSITLTFAEPVLVSALSPAAFQLPSDASLGAGATLAPVVAGGDYARSFVLTLGQGAVLTRGDTLSFLDSAVIDAAGNIAQGGAGFVLPALPPVVTLIQAVEAPLAAAERVFTVAFSSEVAHVAARDFHLSASGVTGTIEAPVSLDGGRTWQVRVTGLGGEGEVRLDLVTAGTAIVDLFSNPLTRDFTDGQPIMVDRVAPETGDFLATPDALANSASATFRLPGADAGVTYEARIDGAAAWSPLAVQGGEFTLAGLGEGAHLVKVRAVDAAGNADATPASYAWTVDTVAPAAGTARVAASTGVVSGLLNAGDRVTIAVSFGEAVVLSAGATAKLVLSNGVELGAASVGADGRSLIFSYAVAQGQDVAALAVESLRIDGGTLLDHAGNPALLAGTGASLGLGVDTVGPVVTFTSTGILTNQPNQKLTGTGEPGRAVTVRDGAMSLGGALVQPNGTWTLDVVLTGDGRHELSARETDRAGNGGEAAPIVYVLDTSAPVVAVSAGIGHVGGSGAARIGADALAATDGRADAGQLLFTIEAAPTLGTLLLDGSALATGGTFTQADIAAGRLAYAADLGASGDDGFRFSLTDGLNTATGLSFGIRALPSPMSGSSGADPLVGGPGADLITGGPGPDRIDGGPGIDMAAFSGARSEYRFAVGPDGIVFMDGPDGKDRMVGIERIQFADGTELDLSAVLAAAEMQPLAGVVRGDVVDYEMLDVYTGPVPGLQFQVTGLDDGEAVGGGATNDFLDLRGGDDAADGGAGDDLIDAGLDSGFLMGGVGTDGFVVIGSSGVPSWSTIGDWEAGERLTLMGWQRGVSRADWADVAGAPGWEGVTLHADLDGDGVYDTSITWTSMTRADVQILEERANYLWIG